jgi:hypothetical protein
MAPPETIPAAAAAADAAAPPLPPFEGYHYTDTDRRILAMTDAEYELLTWERIRAIIGEFWGVYRLAVGIVVQVNSYQGLCTCMAALVWHASMNKNTRTRELWRSRNTNSPVHLRTDPCPTRQTKTRSTISRGSRRSCGCTSRGAPRSSAPTAP